MMKVVVSGYVGKKVTGIGRNLINMLDNTSGDTEYIVYINHDMKDELAFSAPNVRVRTYGVTRNSSLKNLLWTTFVFPFKVKKEKADMALIPNFNLLLFKFRPTAVIMHDLIEFNVPDKFSRLRMFYRTRLADPITARRADRIVTDSYSSERDIMKYLGIKKSKISVVYCGVDQQKFRRMDEDRSDEIFAEKGWPDDFLLYAGTIDHPGKNPMSVIKAYEFLRKNRKYSGSLILAGMPGSGYEAVKTYAERSPYSSDIVFTGFVTDEELIALYSRCGVFVFVSLYEGFGLPPLEALSCGARTVVSNTSSLPEVVGDVGITVDPKDIKAIAAAVYKSLNSSSDSAYNERVREHLKNYDWNRLGIEFEKAIRI